MLVTLAKEFIFSVKELQAKKFKKAALIFQSLTGRDVLVTHTLLNKSSHVNFTEKYLYLEKYM